jgi:dUTP pyrophosphatase
MSKPLKIKVVCTDPKAVVPTQAHSTDAGWDLYSTENIRVTSYTPKAVGTGICIDIPSGYYAEIKERSGVSLRTPLYVKAGVIDAGYRGEIKVIVGNDTPYPFEIQPGDKIAQLIFKKLTPVEFDKVEAFEDTTERNEKGFGSSDNN